MGSSSFSIFNLIVMCGFVLFRHFYLQACRAQIQSRCRAQIRSAASKMYLLMLTLFAVSWMMYKFFPCTSLLQLFLTHSIICFRVIVFSVLTWTHLFATDVLRPLSSLDTLYDAGLISTPGLLVLFNLLFIDVSQLLKVNKAFGATTLQTWPFYASNNCLSHHWLNPRSLQHICSCFFL